MKESDKTQFTASMGEMCVAFQVDPTVELMNVYWKHLQDAEILRFTLSIDDIIKNSNKFPSIADLREKAVDPYRFY